MSHFEAKARAAEQRRRDACTEFSEENLRPIEVLRMSRATFGKMAHTTLYRLLERGSVIFITAGRNLRAFVIPPWFVTLLEVRDALRDETKYKAIHDAFGSTPPAALSGDGQSPGETHEAND